MARWPMPQEPERCSKKRNEKRIEGWVKTTGPLSKKTGDSRAWTAFFDESGFLMAPPVRRTWSPPGHTPLFYQSGRTM